MMITTSLFDSSEHYCVQKYWRTYSIKLDQAETIRKPIMSFGHVASEGKLTLEEDGVWKDWLSFDFVERGQNGNGFHRPLLSKLLSNLRGKR